MSQKADGVGRRQCSIAQLQNETMMWLE